MRTRQATRQRFTLLTLLALLVWLAFIAACSPSQPLSPTSTPNPPASTPSQTLTPSSIADSSTATATRLACLTRPGRIDPGIVESTPPQEYLIYLPPCYDEEIDRRYPVLYLLHGQTYAADQWIRLGAVETLDQLILSGKAQPFIIVFPNDRYWYTETGSGFGDRVVEALVPYIDKTYRTLPDRAQRAIGGMSRGAGWALHLGLSHWDLFSIIGLHSLAVLQEDSSRIERWLQDIPPDSYPTIFMDIGDNDRELAKAQGVEALFNDHGLLHEWHRYNGAHTEQYWQEHVQEYIEWYASQWNDR